MLALRCIGKTGAVVRSGVELDSDLVGEIQTLDLCTAAETQLATNGAERVRLTEPIQGWASRRLFEDANDDTVRVDFKSGGFLMKRLAVRLTSSTTVTDLKKSLAAMTNVPVERQRLSCDDSARVRGGDHLVLTEDIVDVAAEEQSSDRFRYRTGTQIQGRFPSSERKLNFGSLPMA